MSIRSPLDRTVTVLSSSSCYPPDGGTDYLPSDHTLNYMRPPLPNRRTEAQHGAFLWTRGVDHGCRRGGFVVRIRAEHKESISKSLCFLNYDRSHLFPEEPESGAGPPSTE